MTIELTGDGIFQHRSIDDTRKGALAPAQVHVICPGAIRVISPVVKTLQ